MRNYKKIWITNHAYKRFKERILAPNGLLSDDRFFPRKKIINLLKKLAQKAILKPNRDEKLEEDQYRVSWPNPEEPLPDIILVMDKKKQVLKTCWPDNLDFITPDVFRLEKENN